MSSQESRALPAGALDTRRFLSMWTGLSLFLVAVLLVPAMLRSEPRAQVGVTQRLLESLRATQPEIVFLGNSMLETRIDPDYLSELLDGRAVASLAVRGSTSAVWYLQLKKVVAELDPAPRTAFIFFRNDLITQPLSHLDEHNRDLVRDLMRTGDASYDSVIDSNLSLHERSVRAIEQAYPVHLWDTSASNAIQEASAALLPSTRSDLAERADSQFGFHNRLDSDLDPQPIEPAKVFADAYKESFLPLMLELAADRDMRLIFVRVQPRPKADGTINESAGMRRYSQDLAEFLESHDGVAYLDLTGNQALDRTLYYDSFHIRQRYLQHYTELFAIEAAPFLNQGVEHSSGGVD